MNVLRALLQAVAYIVNDIVATILQRYQERRFDGE
jgi:hypothetical protein